ncbi:MAG: IMS domain-containing protein [Cyanobium sp.]
MDLPIDHLRLLGVGVASDAQTVLMTLAQRLERAPDQGFTTETLQARARLLQDSADLLSDPVRRRAYESELMAVSDVATAVPALEIPSSLEVAGLLLLLEAGQHLEAFELACRCLQPPQAPALGSGREADLCLVAALACLAAAEECSSRRHFEAAARLLQQGLQLLQRMGQLPELRQRMGRDLDRLTPYLVLDLLSRELTVQDKRSEGLALLEQLVLRRGGLEGDLDPDFSPEEFQAFFKQIRGFLTVQEQVDLFSRWADAGSNAADFLATTALTASGFAQRKPERIAAARERLLASGRSGIEPLLANLHLLLGEVDAALATFEAGAGREIREWAARQDREPLGQLCAYCRDWLQRDVLPGYRDLDADPDLEAYFSDRDVIRWVEREDRRAGRAYAPPMPSQKVASDFGLSPLSPVPAAAGSATAGTGAGASESFDWGLTPYSSPFTGLPPLPPLQQEQDEEDEEETPLRWHLPDLPDLPDLSRLSLPEIPLAALQERVAGWREAAVSLPITTWLAAAAGLGLLVGGTAWMLRPRPPVAVTELSRPRPPLLPEPTPTPTPTSESEPTPKPESESKPKPTSGPAAGAPAATASRPKPPAGEGALAAGAVITPLTVSQPSEAQLQSLLRSWLETKAAVLAGGDLPGNLEVIARADEVDRLRRQRQQDAAAGHRQRLEVTIQSVRIAEQSPRRIALSTALRYSDQKLDAAGRVIERTPSTVLNNVYVFGRDGSRWRLVAVQPG